jgi:L-fuconolactonase
MLLGLRHYQRLRATYKQRVTHFTEELSFLSEEDKDWVMGKSILERLS